MLGSTYPNGFYSLFNIGYAHILFAIFRVITNIYFWSLAISSRKKNCFAWAIRRNIYEEFFFLIIFMWLISTVGKVELRPNQLSYLLHVGYQEKCHDYLLHSTYLKRWSWNFYFHIRMDYKIHHLFHQMREQPKLIIIFYCCNGWLVGWMDRRRR